VPVSKNKRTTRKRLRVIKKSKRQSKTMPSYLIHSYRSMYIGIGVSFIAISLFLMFFGDGTNEELGVSIVLCIIGIFSFILGKFSRTKDLKKTSKAISNTDIDVL
jgi:hypothetical protein